MSDERGIEHLPENASLYWGNLGGVRAGGVSINCQAV